jgi:hypothetical protein
MSHAQAYHTSCRHGLAGHSGFQFNAASAELSAELLAALASVHAGYHAPRDRPLEPTAEELEDFPVTLKHCPVDGVPVVSRTAYVGREFRGEDDEPDTGRFGNYFSHMVLGSTEDGDPFDGLLAIELWNASHWSTTESVRTDLPELPRLTPGTCDLEWAIATLDGRRRAWLGPVLDASLAAVDGGPRVVLVEPDQECAAAWVAWVSYALPPDRANRLTFSTFEGQPRHAQGLHICVTTPGCDLMFAEYELGREVTLLQPQQENPPSVRRLYARLAADLVEENVDALADAIRDLTGTVERCGAELAIASGRVSLVRDDEVATVVDLLAELVAVGNWDVARATADALPAGAVLEGAVRSWWRVHAVARDSTHEAARDVADAALDRLSSALGRLPEELAPVPSDSPTSPSPGRLAAWLEAVERAQAGGEQAALLWGGVRLGLVGCNVALDRKVADVVCESLVVPEMAETFARLAEDRSYANIVDHVLRRLAGRAFDDERTLPLLQSVLANPALQGATEAFALTAKSFQERAVWERLRVEADPSLRSKALTDLLVMAQSQGRAAEAKYLFGAGGPGGVDDHVALLAAYRDSRLRPAEEDVDGALAALAGISLTDPAQGRGLVDALRASVPRGRLVAEPIFLAWLAAVYVPPKADFWEWTQWVAVAASTPDRPLSNERFEELYELAGEGCARWLRVPVDERRKIDDEAAGGLDRRPPDERLARYLKGVRELAGAFRPEDWQVSAARGLEREIAACREPAGLIANAFWTWSRLPAGTGDLLETALPVALGRVSQRKLEAVERLLSPAGREAWLEWLDRHPPKAGLSRLLRRDGPRR